MATEESLAFRLQCIECERVSDVEAKGWRAYLTDDDEAVTYCPDCAGAEFGDRD